VAAIDKLRKMLEESEKHRGELASRATTIRDAAEQIEKEAIAEQERLQKEMRGAKGKRLEILQAQYLAAIDKARQAGKAYTLANRTLAKLGK